MERGLTIALLLFPFTSGFFSDKMNQLPDYRPAPQILTDGPDARKGRGKVRIAS